ncbi:MAG: threonine/serine exporter family protein [Anaerolineae bacterium]|nr:threonine/serine exporter family protein [Anaerolineae bacterium]
MNGEVLFFVLRDSFWSAIAAVGFAILFNVPPYTLPACALAGAVGHGLRAALIALFGMPIEAATLLAATAVGFLGELLARHYHIPRLVFVVPGVIPMVPGVFAYRTMLGIFEMTGLADLSAVEGAEVLLQTAVYAIRTGLILAGLAFGIIAPNLLFRRQRPII